MPFGKRLKEARLSKNMTQEEVASAVGVTKGAIGNYESEVSSPKEPILIKLMKVLEVDANFLYQDYISTTSDLKKDEIKLIQLYRNADDRAKEDVFDILSKHQLKDTAAKRIS